MHIKYHPEQQTFGEHENLCMMYYPLLFPSPTPFKDFA